MPEQGCFSPIYGEVLVASGVWDEANDAGSVVSLSAILSIDNSGFGGPILNGGVEGNPFVIRIYDE